VCWSARARKIRWRRPIRVAAFENEMRAGAVADWQVISYGNTLHGFANPAADGSMMRTALYNEQGPTAAPGCRCKTCSMKC